MPDVVLPVLDEAQALPWVLERMPPGYRPIVVDNGSSDGSGEIADQLGAEVLVEHQPGFGAACFAGLMAVQSEIVCFMDCDASLDPIELPHVADPVVDGSIDLMLGSRQPEPGAWPLHAKVANKLLAKELARRTGAALTDLGPMRAARRADLIQLRLRDRRFGWPLEMVLRAAEADWKIAEVPVAYKARSGRSKVTGTVRGTARALADMGRLLT